MKIRNINSQIILMMSLISMRKLNMMIYVQFVECLMIVNLMKKLVIYVNLMKN